VSVFTDIQFNIKLQKVTFCNYQLTIDSKNITLSFPQLLQFRNKINKLTETQNLERIIENENFVLLFIADRKHLVFLEVPKLLDLKQEIELCFYSY
jgi:predicted nucleic acid-binding protein